MCVGELQEKVITNGFSTVIFIKTVIHKYLCMEKNMETLFLEDHHLFLWNEKCVSANQDTCSVL